MNASILVVSLSITFSMLDRLFNIVRPVRYKLFYRQFIALTIITCIFGLVLYHMVLFFTEWPVDDVTGEFKMNFTWWNGDNFHCSEILRVFGSFRL